MGTPPPIRRRRRRPTAILALHTTAFDRITMASGVGVHDNCIQAYQDLKLGKKFKYIIFRLTDDFKEIQVEKTSDAQSYDDFLGDLPEESCRFAVYDFEFQLDSAEGKRNKLCFISWAPESAKIKQKMVYASSRDAIRRALIGIAMEIQGTEPSEVAYEALLDKANRR